MTRRTGRQEFVCMETVKDALEPRILGLTMVMSAFFLLMGIGVCIMRDCYGAAF